MPVGTDSSSCRIQRTQVTKDKNSPFLPVRFFFFFSFFFFVCVCSRQFCALNSTRKLAEFVRALEPSKTYVRLFVCFLLLVILLLSPSLDVRFPHFFFFSFFFPSFSRSAIFVKGSEVLDLCTPSRPDLSSDSHLGSFEELSCTAKSRRLEWNRIY